MSRWLTLFVFTLVFIACSTRTEKVNIQSTEEDSLNVKELKLNNDTLFVSSASAVFYEPDSIQIAKRKKSIGEENFMIGADDYLNYMHLSNDFFEKVKLPIASAANKKVLYFKLENGSKEFIKLDTLAELWGIYVFSPDQKPKLIDITDYENEYKNYFKH